jgi:RNA polymerase sigma-70 factor (ECF subfamily)
LYSKAEMRALVENCVMRLPAKYRVVLVLRDLEQLSTEETAAALGLGIPALKARIQRGRLMLREALAPHFAARAKEVKA